MRCTGVFFCPQLGKERDLIKAGQKLPAGDVRVEFAYTHQSNEYGGGGIGRLLIDGKQVAEAKFMHVARPVTARPKAWTSGAIWVKAVSKQHKGPSAFSGTLKDVVFEVS
jgi:hypothetical protein